MNAFGNADTKSAPAPLTEAQWTAATAAVAAVAVQQNPICTVFNSQLCVRTTLWDSLAIEHALLNPHGGCVAVQDFRCPADFADIKLCAGAAHMLTAPNAGGSSEISEALSFQLMHTVFGAKLVKTEMDIQYFWSISKRTDYSAMIYQHKFGVSVTRAMKYNDVFTRADAHRLLTKKLHGTAICLHRFFVVGFSRLIMLRLFPACTGVNMSSRDVVERDAWSKQILHVWAPSASVARTVREEALQMDATLRSNTIIIITVATGAPWMFQNVKNNQNAEACRVS